MSDPRTDHAAHLGLAGIIEAEVRDQYRDLGLDEGAIAEAMSAARDAGMFDVPSWS